MSVCPKKRKTWSLVLDLMILGPQVLWRWLGFLDEVIQREKDSIDHRIG